MGRGTSFTISAGVGTGLDADTVVRPWRLAWRVVLGGAFPPLFRRPRLVGEGDRSPRPRQRAGAGATPLDPHCGVRRRRRRGGVGDAGAAGCDRPFDGRPGRPEVPREPPRARCRPGCLGAAGRGPRDDAPILQPPPPQVPQDQPAHEPLADRRDAGAGPGDVLRPHHAGLRGPSSARAAAGRVLPGLPRHDGLRTAPARRRSQAADAGPRRASRPGLLAPRGHQHGKGLRRRVGDISGPRPRPHARARLAGRRRADRLLAAAATSRCPCR
jgi:hypothetical protein